MRHAVRSLGMSGRARGGGGTAPLIDATAREFQPQDVPEVSNGYWWEPANAIGFGTTSFRVREGNGHSTFDLIQATVANQPTVLTEAGGTQFRMRKVGDAVGASILATATAVRAGWTGPTYIGGWWRLPDASGDATGSNSFIRHSLTTGNQRRLSFSVIASAPDKIQQLPSTDGTNQAGELTQATYTATANYVWRECIFDFALILGGSAPADTVKFFSDFVRLTKTSAGPTVALTQLGDSLAAIEICTAVGAANVDTTDWAACYYANGIPSLANRVRLANRRNPTGILLAA